MRKKNKFINIIYRTLGNFFGTLFFLVIALLGVILVIYTLDFISNIIYLFKEIIPAILGFIVGYLLARLR